jgi:FixJ family two-component response regulator
MIETQLHIAVIDDDVSVRESLPDLLRQLGHAATAFGSAQEFLLSGRLTDFHCLILDIAMPGMSGPELRRELLRRGRNFPVIFITAHPDASVRSMLHQEGPVEVLIKPFSEDALLSALKAALPPR